MNRTISDLRLVCYRTIFSINAPFMFYDPMAREKWEEILDALEALRLGSSSHVFDILLR